MPYGSKSGWWLSTQSRSCGFWRTFQVNCGNGDLCTAAGSAHALDELEKEKRSMFRSSVYVIKPGARTAAGDVTTASAWLPPRSYHRQPDVQQAIRGTDQRWYDLRQGLPAVRTFSGRRPQWEDPWPMNRKALHIGIVDYYWHADTLILGCTHYRFDPFHSGTCHGESVTLVNPAYETARELEGTVTALSYSQWWGGRIWENKVPVLCRR